MKRKFMGLGLAMVSTAGFGMTKGITPEYVPGEVIVKFKEYSSANKSLKSLPVKRLLNENLGLLKFNQKTTMEALLKRLNDRDDIEFAEPNYIVKAIGMRSATGLLTNDPKFSDLWGLKNTGDNEPAGSRGNSAPSGISGADVNAINAWKITKGSRAVRIAVIDTGIDYNHPDLKNNMWVNQAELNGKAGVDDDGNGYIDDIHGYDFANKDGDPMDGNGHGTHCAGTIAAEHDNGIGVAGVMAEAELVGVKFLTDAGSGSTADAISAIDYATKIGVDIMSNSWGGGGYSQALKESIERANRAGIIFTAAAGNSATNNDNSPHFPSNYNVENVISVAAHNYNNRLASFSCYGAETVHVAAPGRNILSTVPGNKYDVYSGTSMATPHVTGVVGLYLAHNGKTDPKTLRDNLMASSVYGSGYENTTVSGGRVDAYDFLMGTVNPRPEKPNPNDWVSTQVASFESAHPYKPKTTISKTYQVAGAKFLRAVVAEHKIEKNYDYLAVLDGQGNEVGRIDGQGTNTVSDYVRGDTITLKFVSDTSVQDWGFVLDELEVIR